MPLLIRSWLSATSGLMPGTSWLMDRVAMSPSIQGTRIASWVWRVARSGMPKIVKLAGAASVSHIASIAATFIFWFCEAV